MNAAMVSAPPAAADHPTSTFLFTDIVGSTRQWEEASDMPERVARHDAVLDEIVGGSSGTVFASLGDGIAAVFPSAERAVHAAVAAQRAMPDLGLEVRMGIHTGEVIRVGDDYRGRAVNRAARVMAAAHGGQVLLTDVSASLVRHSPCPVELRDVGDHHLPGLGEPERLWQVVHPDLTQDFPSTAGARVGETNLPIPRSSLIGRHADVAKVHDLLDADRIVTLTGVGGVGKTRLAVQVATELVPAVDHVWFVELGGVVDEDDVISSIARAIGAGAVASSPTAIAALLAGQRALLLIDNCEHVIDRVADAVDALTATCPHVTILATSREALGVDGERVMAVRPLDPATSATALFRYRAVAAGADLTGVPAELLEHVCRRLDGIPLAIELAAARSASLGVPATLAALDGRLDLLTGGRRRAIDRHSTMRATIDWSYRLLDDGERQLFRWLGVFPGGFELDAAVHVGARLDLAEPAATARLSSLVDKSMVVAEPAGPGVRYRMLEAVRTFAVEQLDADGERRAAVRALAEWMTTITDHPIGEPATAAVERSALRLEREEENWREAVMLAARDGDADLAARLCGPPTSYFVLGRHDLAELVRPLWADLDLDGCERRGILAALLVSSAGTTPSEQLDAWAEEMARLDDADPAGPSGLAYLMRWLVRIWRGDHVDAVTITAAGAADERLSAATRDLLLGIATVDHFSLVEAGDDPHRLLDRAPAVAARTDVAMHRVLCLLGVAWGVAATEPDVAFEHVRRALAAIPEVPLLTRMTLPGTASRLLTRLDPAVAARGLLEQLDTAGPRRSFVDLVPVFYGVALLERVGHPAARPALATLPGPTVAPILSMMDFVGLARRTVEATGATSLPQLETIVRSALAEVARG